MEQTSVEGNQTKVQIIESTCLLNKKFNRNNAIDGTNIIYLAGASIVFHNIFQNNKKFISRISDTDVVGMAFFKSSQNIVALATKAKNCLSSPQSNEKQAKPQRRLNIELYVLGEQGNLLAELSENIEFIDMEFLQKKRILLLAREFDGHYFYFLESGKKLRKKQVNIHMPKRFICQDRKISVLGEMGIKDLDLQMQSLAGQLKYPEIQIQDYAIIDNEFEIILQKNKLYSFHELQMMSSLDLSHYEETLQTPFEPSCIVHVGRNLLIAHKNSITISHFIVDHKSLKFLNHYSYKEKIKGGIVSMEVSFDEMHLAMAVDIFDKESSKIENFMFNLSILSSEKKFISPFIRLFPLGNQNAQISSLHGVISFQTYYLSGNTIVNYSYNDSIEKKFKFSLHETPKLLCVHPLGYQFFCLFQNQVKFYIKIESELVEIWNQPYVCSYAKYMTCGHLLMAVLEDGFYQLVVYDANSFAKIRNVANIMAKHPVTRIQLIEQDSQVVLHIGHDLAIYNVKTGEKTAEYREKKDKEEILALAYDPNHMTLLASAANKTLTYSKKLDEVSWQFKFQKTISLGEQITAIEINPTLETVFMGTKSGKLLWTQYPLNLIETEDLTYAIEYKEIKLSQHPISHIHITKNLKYMFVAFKHEGLTICRLKKMIKYRGSNRFAEFDISNLNFLETSSKTCLQTGYEKLKSLLEKRKTVFNDLEEYKKQWQGKKNKTIKALGTQNKHKQLEHINEALHEVQKVKQEKQSCHQQIRLLEEQTQTFVKEQQQKYQRQIMLFYDKNIELRVKKEKKASKCHQQFNSIEAKCRQNIEDIEKELKKKYSVFMENYQEMKHNLTMFDKRFDIEKKQAQEILLQLFQEKRQKLTIEENAQNKISNELKALITRFKKESERYNSRKYFLEQKTNYFVEELNFCRKEREDLLDVKQDLQVELRELELFTNKKEKRLRKYFKENEILTKYQHIHNNLVCSLDGEVDFLESQKGKTAKNIVSIQKELSEVAELNENYEAKIEDIKKTIQKMDSQSHSVAEKTRYLQHLIEEMSEAIEKIKSNLNEENKAELFSSIYREFFIRRKLENILQSSTKIDTNKQDTEMEYKIFNSAQNKKAVLENMKKHKNYLEKNMNLFEKHNKKTDEEMNLNHLKYQTQNYNLIAECNVRKEQTNKKKRILHQLIDSVKETQLYMNELQKENFDEQKMIKSVTNTHLKSSQSIPFIQYKKNKEQTQKSRSKVLRKQQSEPTLWKVRQSTYQVRKMLDIQKVARPGSENKIERRIQTAMIKRNQNATNELTAHIESSEYINVNVDLTGQLKKPMTATGKRHQAPFGQYYTYNGGKNKSASKPTTCTTHTHKNKYSIYH